eukprot:TRINITY_DN9198_c0_g1_i1.p1 TRINITY_DN9198_c0_g1~~TRINITY_DN9198_c0_g1_i1.p1  ORF type:complete len:666 (-),score=92.63 TRINITY_DN9198_c0_g1_i1:327-2324(-)
MMNALSFPVVVEELFQLTALGIQPYDISFTTLTLNGDKYICVRELLKVSEDIVIVDVSHPGRCLRFPTKAEAAIVHPRCRIVALRAGTMVQVFNIDLKSRLCHVRMQQPVIFWKWISETMIVLVTQTGVFHWSIEGNHEMVEVFERNASEDVQVVNYIQDPSGKWVALVSISYKDKVVGQIQLFSLETKESLFFDGSVAAFAEFTPPAQSQASTFFCYAAATENGIRVVVQPLEAHGVVNKDRKASHDLPTKVPSRAASPSPLFNSNSAVPSNSSPPDFPVSMQYSDRYGFLFLVSKVGQFFLLSMDSMFLSTELFFYECLLPETLFVTSFHSPTSGLLGVSQKGKVFLVTVNESAIIPFIAQFGAEEVAYAVANRASIPWSLHSQSEEPAEGDILSLLTANLRQTEHPQDFHHGSSSSFWSQKHLSAKQLTLTKNSPFSSPNVNHHRLSPGPPSPPTTFSPNPFSPHPLNLHSSGSLGSSETTSKNSLLSQLQQNSIPYTPPAYPQATIPNPIAPYPRSRSPSPAPRLFTEVSCYQIMKDFSIACVSNNPRHNNGLIALAANSGNVIVFSLVDEKVMCSINPAESPILALSFCPTKDWLCAASPRSILIYSLETRELIEQIKLKPAVSEGGHPIPPCCVVLQWDFSGSVLYAIFNDKKILRWTF